MGYYTVKRGWIQIISAGSESEIEIIKNKLKEIIAKTEYGEGSFVIQGVWNGAVYLLLGTKVKDYEFEIEAVIEKVAKTFPNSEGIIHILGEENEGEETILIIKNGKVTKRKENYGFQGHHMKFEVCETD